MAPDAIESVMNFLSNYDVTPTYTVSLATMAKFVNRSIESTPNLNQIWYVDGEL